MLSNLSGNSLNNKKSPYFGNNILVSSAVNVLGSNAMTTGFTLLESNQAIKIAALDLTTMVGPRTYVDWQQNPDYGKETAFREATALAINPFMPGVVGMGLMATQGLNGLYVNSSTLKTLHEAWKQVAPEGQIGNDKQKEVVKKFFENIFNNSKGTLENTEKPLKEIFKKEGEDFGGFIDKLAKAALTDDNKQKKELMSKTAKSFTNATKSSNVNVSLGEGIETSIDNLVRDTVSTVNKVFIKHKPSELGDVVDNLGKFIKTKSAIAIASTLLVGASLQQINANLTKQRTGSDEFAGYKDFGAKKDKKEAGENNKSGLLAKKMLASAGIIGMTLASIGAFGKKGFFKPGNWKEGLKNFQNAMELNDTFAHLNVIKVIYGTVLTGRFMAARDETEVKTGVARDYTGFLNWLVLGPFVAKGVAQVFDKSLLNGTIKGNNPIRQTMSWLSDVSLKTGSEVKAMLTKAKAKPDVIKRTMAIHNAANIAGIGYSMFALGIGVPYLINKYIINGCGKDHKCENNEVKEPKNNSFTGFLNQQKDKYPISIGLLANG